MPTATILVLLFVLLLTIAVPLGGMLCLARAGGRWKDFFVGAGTFILFALLLEQGFHSLVLLSGAGAALQANIWAYGLYGGLAAGLFEETGRLLAFRFLLNRRQSRVTALAYGIGHGGIEAFLLAGLSMLSNLVLGLTYARGGQLPAEAIPLAKELLATPATLFLWSGFERLAAMALHIALSILVFAALRTGRRRLFLAAVLLHAAVDFVAVVSNAYLPIAATELLVLAFTAAALLFAAPVYKKLPKA